MRMIRVVGGVGDLARDQRAVVTQARRDMRATVNESARDGNRLAKGFAKESAGKHGKHYHKAFTWEPVSGRGLFGNTYSAEYGPQIDRPQGGMSFERGSRNQPPHLDLARSADIEGPAFAHKVQDLPGKWF